MNTNYAEENDQTISLADILEPPRNIETADAVKSLLQGELNLHGLMPWSSNYTFLGTINHNHIKFNFIYKPCQGERPLWDFEQGTLCRREVAAFLVSRALDNWACIPPTVLRNGPYGPGSLQQFIHADYNIHYFSLKDKPQFQPYFQKLALFDYVINNADRKGGHCLLDSQNTLWAIDHGLAFHTEPKLRTVIWDFAGQSIALPLHETLKIFRKTLTPKSDLYQNLSALLLPAEIEGIAHRLDALLKTDRFPHPSGRQDYPYPPI